MLSLIIEVFLIGVYVLAVVIIQILLKFIACPCIIKHIWHFFTISILKLVRDALCNRDFTEFSLGIVLLSIASKIYIKYFTGRIGWLTHAMVARADLMMLIIFFILVDKVCLDRLIVQLS